VDDYGSITRLITDLKEGQDVTRAQQELWDRYFHRVAALARKKLQGVRRTTEDEEDVAVSVLKSLFLRIGDHRFPLLCDRHNLWPLLVKITACKAINLRNRLRAAKRGGRKMLSDSAIRPNKGKEVSRQIDEIVSREPTPGFAVQLAEEYQRLLDDLPNEDLKLVAQRKVEAYTNQEIAEELGVTERTVERKLKLLRRIWEREVVDLEPR
jgi:DNA-directed RNA polymerase specialized sigma24 family protein